MISKTSLFNKGIFRSTFRRYIWGSVLYFILLFMTTGLMILLGVDKNNVWRYMSNNRTALILEDIYIIFPILIGMFASTVVALLTFRFVHSKKTSVFVHSLPVSRNANYVSSCLAGLSLMGAPIVINGLILMVISWSGYGGLFDTTSCFVWMGMNLLTVFMMFSVATMSAMITGNSFAMVGLNGLLHCFALIITGSFSILAECFVYGYNNNNELLNAVLDWNFINYIFGTQSTLQRVNFEFDFVKLALMVGYSLVLYVIGWVLYKKRRMETAEDVAAFRCLNPIYKYFVTFIASLGTFGIFNSYASKEPLLLTFIIVIVSLVIYFGAEMILKKTLKVWHSYKGYLAFGVAFSAMVCVFALTTFFGYETRIPEEDRVKSVEIYEFYYQDDEPYLSDDVIIDYARDVHKKLIQEDRIHIVNKFEAARQTGIHIKYELENGKTISRRYPVSEKEACEIMEELYKSKNYKLKNADLFGSNIDEIYSIGLNYGDVRITEKSKIDELYACIKRDVLDLDYSQMYNHESWGINLNLEYADKRDKDNGQGGRSINNINREINANYKNTLNWLKENGYWWSVINVENNDMCILTPEQLYVEEKYVEDIRIQDAESYKRRINNFEEISGAEKITNSETKLQIADFITSRGIRFVPEKEYSHYVCMINSNGYTEVIGAIYEEDADALLQIAE